MTNFSNFTRSALAAVGALVISTAFIVAAVGPAAATAQSPAATYAAAQLPVSVQADA